MTPGSVQLIRPSIFDDIDHVVVAFSTRTGGVSEPPFDTLNMAVSTGDAEANVMENRERLAVALGVDIDGLALTGQVHGGRIKAVVAPGLYKGYDGMVTRTEGIWLAITAADCATVLLADPKASLIGACHAGWRGTVKRITVDTVKAMERVGAVPDRLRAWIGPCISVEKFEVGEEVASEFHRDHVERRDAWPRPHVDMKAALNQQLQQAGIPEHQIEISPHCTASDTARFFSHRAEGGKTGRMFGVIALQSP